MPEIKQDIRGATFVVAANDSLHKNMADYVCDGTADDVEIQAAIDALPAGGGEVVLLEGTYSITTNIVPCNNMTLKGQGMGTVIELGAAIMGIYMATKHDVRICHLQIDNSDEACPQGLVSIQNACYNIYLDHLYLQGDATGTDGIVTQAVGVNIPTDIYISDCIGKGFINAGCTAFEISDGSTRVTLTNCLADGCVRGFDVHTHTGAEQIFDITFRDCSAINCTEFALYSQPDTPAEGHNRVKVLGGYFDKDVLFNSNYNPIVDGITVRLATYGIKFFACSDFIAVNNHCLNNASRGIMIDTFNNGGLVAHNRCVGPNFGITLQVSNTNIKITDNDLRDNVTPLEIKAGADTPTNITHEQHSDPFIDVLAASANLIVNAQNFIDGAIALTGVQPKYPRGLVFAITAGVTEYTLTVVGTDSKGKTITEIFTFADDGLAFSSDNAFDHVTSITLADRAGAVATIDVGIDERLGLMNVIYETGDIWKITKNIVKQVVAVAQVDVDYDIYDMSVIGLALNDDFEIWYRSNLNIVA